MTNEPKDVRQNISACDPSNAHFIWPLGKKAKTPDEMNTSYGPRIDADRWDFHDASICRLTSAHQSMPWRHRCRVLVCINTTEAMWNMAV